MSNRAAIIRRNRSRYISSKDRTAVTSPWAASCNNASISGSVVGFVFIIGHVLSTKTRCSIETDFGGRRDCLQALDKLYLEKNPEKAVRFFPAAQDQEREGSHHFDSPRIFFGEYRPTRVRFFLLMFLLRKGNTGTTAQRYRSGPNDLDGWVLSWGENHPPRTGCDQGAMVP